MLQHNHRIFSAAILGAETRGSEEDCRGEGRVTLQGGGIPAAANNLEEGNR